jgi:hypothetical protein
MRAWRVQTTTTPRSHLETFRTHCSQNRKNTPDLQEQFQLAVHTFLQNDQLTAVLNLNVVTKLGIDFYLFPPTPQNNLAVSIFCS